MAASFSPEHTEADDQLVRCYDILKAIHAKVFPIDHLFAYYCAYHYWRLNYCLFGLFVYNLKCCNSTGIFRIPAFCCGWPEWWQAETFSAALASSDCSISRSPATSAARARARARGGRDLARICHYLGDEEQRASGLYADILWNHPDKRELSRAACLMATGRVSWCPSLGRPASENHPPHIRAPAHA